MSFFPGYARPFEFGCQSRGQVAINEQTDIRTLPNQFGKILIDGNAEFLEAADVPAETMTLHGLDRFEARKRVLADLEALPPGLGGPVAAAEQLDALQARQFLVWQRLGEGITLTDAARGLEEWPVDWALSAPV